MLPKDYPEFTRAEQKNALTHYLIEQLSDLLQLEENEELDTEIGFFDLGLTSLMLTDFSDILRRELVSTFEPGTLFSYNNTVDLVGFFLASTIDFGRSVSAPEVHSIHTLYAGEKV